MKEPEWLSRARPVEDVIVETVFNAFDIYSGRSYAVEMITCQSKLENAAFRALGDFCDLVFRLKTPVSS